MPAPERSPSLLTVPLDPAREPPAAAGTVAPGTARRDLDALPSPGPEAFPGLAATLRSVPAPAAPHEQPSSGDGRGAGTLTDDRLAGQPSPGEAALTLRLPDAEVRHLWSRLATVAPGLEHFSPSPLMATAALETLVGDALGGGWIEVRRVPGGLVGASGWVIRAHGLERTGLARLREIVEDAGPIVASASPPARSAHLRRHLRPTRLALAAATATLLGLVAVLGSMAPPG